MLCISRRIDDTIVCEPPNFPPITLRVLSLGTASVRLGIDADSGCTILRGELLPRDPEPRDRINRVSPADVAALLRGETIYVGGHAVAVDDTVGIGAYRNSSHGEKE